MDEVLNRLIDLVTSTAPELWAAALEQVRAMAMQAVLWMTVCLVAFGACIFLADWARKQAKVDEDFYVAAMLFGAVGVGCLIVLGVATTDLIGLVMAPKYHAIEQLMNLVK